MSIVTVVGNPRTGSRTYGAAVAVADAIADRLGGHLGFTGDGAHALGLGGAAVEHQAEVVDLSALAPVILDPGPHAALEVALELVASASVVVFASPTYKATYTGLLKAFVDRFPPDALAGKTALPVLVMGDPRHALAVETHFRPLLVELGAHVPTPGLALLESELPGEDAIARWADRVGPQIVTREEALR
ncbi:NADPH-dependent FMN reductase [Nonomuraea endophytica]|uniref:FMN reductase n=1 Tax=Nonomuraea endophytica TaxID=714136 RepID=A0A7W8AD19_9ACTN|nr:NAD(P)H-dependent oxidoreductase [Nonomuraea endophytica]MBB5083449.1 FMN reductase [Nonomuraea endophytica]